MRQEDDVTIVTRKELYDRVWTTPKAQLAKEFDTSPTCIRRACDSHDIPWPDKSHLMTAKRWGTASPTPPLPVFDDPSTDEVRLLRRHLLVGNWPARLAKSQASSMQQPVAATSGPPPQVELSGLHSLVAESGRQLQRAKPDEYGWLQPRRSDCLDIVVSRNSLARALFIYDAFLGAWENAGGTVTLGTWWFKKTLTTLVGLEGV